MKPIEYESQDVQIKPWWRSSVSLLIAVAVGIAVMMAMVIVLWRLSRVS